MLRCSDQSGEVNRNLMSSPIQSVGKLSMISQREDILISKQKTLDRENFLINKITLKKEGQEEAFEVTS